VSLPEDLDRIDVTMRQLQVKWDLFFNGAEKKPPSELQAQVEALIKRHSGVEIRNNTDRFRYQSLSARFTTFNELWQKRLRAREEGKVFGMHGLRAEQMPPPPAAAAPPAPRAAGEGARGGEYRVSDPAADLSSVRALYERFAEERQRAGEGPPPAFESFRDLIGQQTARIRAEKGAAAVDFRLETKGGKVSLKARIVK
jgi:hypothetical protein